MNERRGSMKDKQEEVIGNQNALSRKRPARHRYRPGEAGRSD